MSDISDDSLEHHGVKGQKWGVRKDHTSRDAEKDAKEFARAKMFYGQGAGTRRKLINEKVAAKKKASDNYAKAFDSALEKQDLGKHGDKAVRERTRIDRADRTKKTAGYMARKFTGEWGTQAAFTAVAVSGVTFLASPKGRTLLNKSMSKLSRTDPLIKAAEKLVEDALRK